MKLVATIIWWAGIILVPIGFFVLLINLFIAGTTLTFLKVAPWAVIFIVIVVSLSLLVVKFVELMDWANRNRKK